MYVKDISVNLQSSNAQDLLGSTKANVNHVVSLSHEDKSEQVFQASWDDYCRGREAHESLNLFPHQNREFRSAFALSLPVKRVNDTEILPIPTLTIPVKNPILMQHELQNIRLSEMSGFRQADRDSFSQQLFSSITIISSPMIPSLIEQPLLEMSLLPNLSDSSALVLNSGLYTYLYYTKQFSFHRLSHFEREQLMYLSFQERYEELSQWCRATQGLSLFEWVDSLKKEHNQFVRNTIILPDLFIRGYPRL